MGKKIFWQQKRALFEALFKYILKQQLCELNYKALSTFPALRHEVQTLIFFTVPFWLTLTV